MIRRRRAWRFARARFFFPTLAHCGLLWPTETVRCASRHGRPRLCRALLVPRAPLRSAPSPNALPLHSPLRPRPPICSRLSALGVALRSESQYRPRVRSRGSRARACARCAASHGRLCFLLAGCVPFSLQNVITMPQMLEQPVDRTAAATGLSRSTVIRIVNGEYADTRPLPGKCLAPALQF